jgi:hypothetical protein
MTAKIYLEQNMDQKLVQKNKQLIQGRYQHTFRGSVSFKSLNETPQFRDEMFRNVKTPGYNVRGRIVWGRNVWRRNIQRRIVLLPLWLSVALVVVLVRDTRDHVLVELCLSVALVAALVRDNKDGVLVVLCLPVAPVAVLASETTRTVLELWIPGATVAVLASRDDRDGNLLKLCPPVLELLMQCFSVCVALATRSSYCSPRQGCFLCVALGTYSSVALLVRGDRDGHPEELYLPLALTAVLVRDNRTRCSLYL